MIDEKSYANNVENQWCPGCPNFGILQTLKKALAKLGKAPHEICLVSGIGQAAKLPHYLKCNFFNGLHGRAIPAATGISAANPDLTTIVVTGEGDCYGEGGNHFIHALRRNVDITVMVHNNEIYALTKGQASPTTPAGEKRTLQIHGVEHAPINMKAVAIAHDCGFVAAGFAGDPSGLESLMVEAIEHRGFSFLEIVQPCITWGTHPVKWYKERMEKIGDDHDPSNKADAFQLATEKKENFKTGVFYRGAEGNVFGTLYRKGISGSPLAKIAFLDEKAITAEIEKFKV